MPDVPLVPEFDDAPRSAPSVTVASPRTTAFGGSPVIRALDLPQALEERLDRYLARSLKNSQAAGTALREAVREAVSVRMLRGETGPPLVEAMEALVIDYARECGHTTTSFVTGRPRAAATARRVARWTAEICAPDHACLRRRRERRRSTAKSGDLQAE
jgi:hypothetical protein